MCALTSESESVLRYLLKKLLLLFSSTLSSSVLVMLPLCMRYMPNGLFTKKGWASCTEAVPAVGYLTWPIPTLPEDTAAIFIGQLLGVVSFGSFCWPICWLNAQTKNTQAVDQSGMVSIICFGWWNAQM